MSETTEGPRARARATEMQSYAPHFAQRPAVAVAAEPAPGSERIRARAFFVGQTPTQLAPPIPAPVPIAPPATAPMTLAEATTMLPGLQEAVRVTESALKTGAKCPDVKASDLETARMFKDKMAQFVAAGVADSTMTVERPWLDAGDKVVRCAIQAEAAAPNTGAYVVLGALAIGTIVALSV